MSSEWLECEVGNLCDVTSSKRIFAHDYVNSGIPFFSSKDVIDKALGSYTSHSVYISEKRFLDIADKFGYPSSGDLLLSSVGNRAGISYVIQNEGQLYFKDGNITWFKNFRSLNSDFLCYWLKSEVGQSALNSIMIGSAQKALTIAGLLKLKIKVPPLIVQDRIVSIFKSLDDRITLLRETNATLEAIAQALFKSWFVDFDPVHSKQQGRTPEGMDEATAALFPESFEESEQGLVPKGWRVRSLDDIATYLNGLALQKFPPEADNWLPVIKIAQLRKGDTSGADRSSGNIKPEYIIKNGDVLFSWSGSLEVEVWCGGDGALNQHLFKVTSDKFPKWFYYLWTKHHLENFRQIAASKATTMGHIQRGHLSQAKVIAPSDEFVSAVSEYFSPLLDRWISTALKAQTLATLRDTLLPRLISGQLRLPEAEAMLAEA